MRDEVEDYYELQATEQWFLNTCPRRQVAKRVCSMLNGESDPRLVVTKSGVGTFCTLRRLCDRYREDSTAYGSCGRRELQTSGPVEAPAPKSFSLYTFPDPKGFLASGNKLPAFAIFCSLVESGYRTLTVCAGNEHFLKNSNAHKNYSYLEILDAIRHAKAQSRSRGDLRHGRPPRGVNCEWLEVTHSVRAMSSTAPASCPALHLITA
ncbi:hypothetical protein J6590_054783 [Homalodisca vitripennis]|nr:hypothetical protein J6590_054783 [Homalodisca vitripennis]